MVLAGSDPSRHCSAMRLAPHANISHWIKVSQTMICERRLIQPGSKKGTKECVYPEPRPNTKPASKLGQVQEDVQQRRSSSDQYVDEEHEHEDDPIPSDQHQKVAPNIRRRSRPRLEFLNGGQSFRYLKTTQAPSVEDPRIAKRNAYRPRQTALVSRQPAHWL